MDNECRVTAFALALVCSWREGESEGWAAPSQASRLDDRSDMLAHNQPLVSRIREAHPMRYLREFYLA